MQRTPNVLADQRPSVLGAKNHVYQNEAERLSHASQYVSRLQRSSITHSGTWGFTPGWYGFAPSALVAVALICLLGCHSTKSTPATLKPATRQTAAYPTRPTTPPPPFKLFHAADGTFTLIVSSSATNDQIVSLIYQLRDAAHAGTFDKLRISQKTVDARDPTVWFHIYRGAKCAAEKYAPGAPPCGASYHAAGDYTFGSYKPRDWDEGALLGNTNTEGDGAETQLWAAGSPYKAPGS